MLSDTDGISLNSDFHFYIRYRPGSANGDADALSRMPLNIEEFMDKCTMKSSQETVQSHVSMINSRHNGDLAWISSLTVNKELITAHLESVEDINGNKVSSAR